MGGFFMLHCFCTNVKNRFFGLAVLLVFSCVFLVGCNFLVTPYMYLIEAYYEEGAAANGFLDEASQSVVLYEADEYEPTEENGLPDEASLSAVYEDDDYETEGDRTYHYGYLGENAHHYDPYESESTLNGEYEYEPTEAVYAVYVEQSRYSLETAVVVRVIDGDTVVLDSGERVRLIGVDAPEVGERGASEATQFVTRLVYGQTVWLEADGNDRDSFGRLRRYVWLSYPTAPRDPEQIVSYQLNALLLIYGHAEVMIVGTPRYEALFRSIAQTAAYEPLQSIQATPQFIGNRNSLIFHTLTCSTLPAERNRIYFVTREEALSAGHRACNRCNP